MIAEPSVSRKKGKGRKISKKGKGRKVRKEVEHENNMGFWHLTIRSPVE